MKETGLDSRCSWKVVAACFVIKFLSFGVAEVAGILMVASMHSYETTREKASLPYVLVYSIRNGIGPFIAYFSYKIGSRRITLLGCVTSSVAIGACFFAESILTVTILFGIVFGVGLGLETLLLNAIIIEHFKKHTAKAMGLSSTGLQLGVFFFSPFLEYLINKFGLNGAFLVISGLTLNSIPAAMVLLLNQPEDGPHTRQSLKHTEMKSNHSHTINTKLCSLNEKIHIQSKIRKRGEIDRKAIYTIEQNIPMKISQLARTDHCDFQDDRNMCDKNLHSLCVKVEDLQLYSTYTKDVMETKRSKAFPNGQNTSFLVSDLSQSVYCCKYTPSTIEKGGIESKDKKSKELLQIECTRPIKCEETQRPAHNLSHKIDQSNSKNVMIRLFSDPIFLLSLLSGGMYYFSYPTFLTIIVDFSIDSGIDTSYTKYVLIWSSASEFVGSVLLGYVTDGGWMSYNGFASLCFLGVSLSTVIIVLCKQYIVMALLITLFQFGIAGLTMNYPSVIAESIEKDLQSPAIASMFILAAPLNLGSSPLIGYFRDRSGSYAGVFFTIAGAALLGSLLHLFISKLQKSRNINNQTAQK